MKEQPLAFIPGVMLGLLVGLMVGCGTHKQSPVQFCTPDVVESVEPPLALGPEPKEPTERVRWIERIVENRMARALDHDPDAKQGPATDVLAVKLAAFVKRLLAAALALAVTAAVAAYVWAHWPVIAAWSAVHLFLSWLAGRWGSKSKPS